MTSREILETNLLRALDDWQGDTLSTPWDGIVAIVAEAVDNGRLTLEGASRLDFLLRSTTSADMFPPPCPACDCPKSGLCQQ